jgi:hypothetical protein
MDPIIFEALLVQAQAECLRVILGPYCLEFAAADVDDVQELPPPAGLVEGSAIAARVTLQAGARVMRIASAGAYHALLWKHRLPFALASRPNLIFDSQPAMRRAEEAFFAARGLRELLP